MKKVTLRAHFLVNGYEALCVFLEETERIDYSRGLLFISSVKPRHIKFTSGMMNRGPDADVYKVQSTGKIEDGDSTGKAIATFTPHLSSVSLVFDRRNTLKGKFKDSGFLLRFGSSSTPGSLPGYFGEEGCDLLNIKLHFIEQSQNFEVSTVRVVRCFSSPAGSVLKNNELYIRVNEFLLSMQDSFV